MPLGSLLGPLEALLGGLWTQKPSKTKSFLRFLKMQLFGSLKVLMALLGSSCPLLGRSGPKMGPKMGPKSGPKSDQKVVQKMTPKMTKKSANFGPQNGPQNGPRWRDLLTVPKDGHLFFARWPRDGPRWPKMTPRWQVQSG